MDFHPKKKKVSANGIHKNKQKLCLQILVKKNKYEIKGNNM